MPAGTRLTASTGSPPPASARLRKSVVVVTPWMRCCANPGDSKPSQMAMTARRSTIHNNEGPRGAALPCVSLTLAAGDPDALRHHAMDVLLGVGDGPDAAIHRDAGKPISIEAGKLLLGLEQLDHAHRGILNRPSEIGPLDTR